MLKSPTILYKALNDDGTSPYAHFKWDLPKGKRPGKWMKTDPPYLCRSGFHGFRKIEAAEAAGPRIFEMEIRGNRTASDSEKVAASEARLLREIIFEPVVQERGIRLCEKCGKPHDRVKRSRGRFAASWAAEDGHSYYPEPWEVFATRVLYEKDQILAEAKLTKSRAIADYPSRANTSYVPVAPSFHKGGFKEWEGHTNKCGTCGLGEAEHDGWEERVALAEEFTHADRWELLLVIQSMRKQA